MLRTLILGAAMVLPGLFLAYLVWMMAGNPTTEPLESLICNGIPLTSIGLGLFFGWKSGEDYSVNIEQLRESKATTVVQNITYNIQDSAISGDLNANFNSKDL